MLRLSRLAEKARSIAGIDFLDTARRAFRETDDRDAAAASEVESHVLVHRNQRHALEPEGPAFNPAG